MEFTECTRIVFNRIKQLEPENITKIIGYLLLQDHGEQQMSNLALSPDSVIHDVINKAKTDLQQMVSSPGNESGFGFNPFSRGFPVTSAASAAAPFVWERRGNKQCLESIPLVYPDTVSEFQNQAQFMNLEDQMEKMSLENGGFSSYGYGRGCRRVQTLSELPVKICHYFNKGFCKHGSNCRYFHAHVSDGFHPIFGEGFIDDHVFSPGSLEKLEFELVELLKSRRGSPISIASLPMLYYEKFGKVLQADGYLTESQRHGKAGYSLTKLLARLKNSIRLIDRPHGQHAVVLAEDASKYLETRMERNDPGPIVSGSRQIYLTFPAESTFSEDEVSNYFSTYGPVEDVRIPCQQKRMFGFVTFASSDTVRIILAKGNPHFVCGARVLVKPYREKSKLIDKRYHERMDPFFCSQYIDMDPEVHSFSQGCETSRLIRKQMMEEQEQAMELQRRRFMELQLMQKPVSNPRCLSYSMDGLRVPEEDHMKFRSTEHVNYLLDVLNNGSNTDSVVKYVETKHNDHESDGLNLPDSPFATLANGTTVI